MSLIQFENLPSTNTPITAENLNNNFEYLEDKTNLAEATAYRVGTQTISAGDTIEMTNIETSNSDKFSLSSGKIKIGASVSKIRISGQVWYYSGCDRQWFFLRKNNDTIAQFIVYVSSGKYHAIAIPETIISVAQNDTISVMVTPYDTVDFSVNNGAPSGGGITTTFLNVEEL